MLPNSLKQIILDYKYSLETHENHTRLMFELKDYSYRRVLNSICMSKFLFYNLKRLEFQFETQINKFLAEVSKFETRVGKLVFDVTGDRTFGPGDE